MWPLYPLSQTLIGITVTPEYLSCSWVEKSFGEFSLKAYAKQTLLHYEAISPIIYNSSRLKHYIVQFLDAHKLHNAFALFACENADDTLPQQIVMQYQLLALTIPLNCVMVTSNNTVSCIAQNSLHNMQLSDTFNTLENEERLQAIGLYLLGKKLYDKTS